jgi:hypothetical protein
MRLHARAGRRRVEAEQEDLLLVDLRAFPRFALQDGGAARVELEAARADGLSLRVRESGAQREAAAQAARRLVVEVVDPVATVDPAPPSGRGAVHLEGALDPRVAEADHRRVETRLDLARALDAPGRRELRDACRGVGDARRDQQAQQDGESETARRRRRAHGVTRMMVASAF